MNTKSLFTALIILAMTAFGSVMAQDAAMPGQGVKVQPGLATWQSAQPLEAIFDRMLGMLGYDVQKPQSLSNPIFYQSVAQGDIDFWANGWFPIHNGQLPKNFDDTAARVGTIVEKGALQGYLVDKASAEKYNITSLDDFKRDEVREAFDANGDGKADLVACPPGWGCEQVISHHLKVYELEDVINPITAAYAASFADALARYRNGQPVLYYTWTPNFTVFKLKPGEDVVWINVPETIPTEAQTGLEDAMVLSGVKGAVSDPIKMGFVANDIQVVANKAFLEKNPAAHKLFEIVQIPLADVSSMTARISDGENSEEEIAAMADAWIEANREQVDSWLEQARAAAE